MQAFLVSDFVIQDTRSKHRQSYSNFPPLFTLHFNRIVNLLDQKQILGVSKSMYLYSMILKKKTVYLFTFFSNIVSELPEICNQSPGKLHEKITRENDDCVEWQHPNGDNNNEKNLFLCSRTIDQCNMEIGKSLTHQKYQVVAAKLDQRPKFWFFSNQESTLAEFLAKFAIFVNPSPAQDHKQKPEQY